MAFALGRGEFAGGSGMLDASRGKGGGRVSDSGFIGGDEVL